MRINFDARLIGHAGGNRFVEVGPFLILNQNVADDLHLMRMGIIRMRHLGDQTRLARVGDVENAQRHRRGAKVRQIDIAPMFDELHAVAMTVQVMMADHPHVPTFASSLDVSNSHGSANLPVALEFTPICCRRVRLTYNSRWIESILPAVLARLKHYGSKPRTQVRFRSLDHKGGLS